VLAPAQHTRHPKAKPGEGVIPFPCERLADGRNVTRRKSIGSARANDRQKAKPHSKFIYKKVYFTDE
jgi:hypothetical protein